MMILILIMILMMMIMILIMILMMMIMITMCEAAAGKHVAWGRQVTAAATLTDKKKLASAKNFKKGKKCHLNW